MGWRGTDKKGTWRRWFQKWTLSEPVHCVENLSLNLNMLPLSPITAVCLCRLLQHWDPGTNILKGSSHPTSTRQIAESEPPPCIALTESWGQSMVSWPPTVVEGAQMVSPGDGEGCWFGRVLPDWVRAQSQAGWLGESDQKGASRNWI